MKSISSGAVAVSVLGLSLAGCASATPSPEHTEGSEAAASGTVVLQEDFDDDRNEWGIVDGEFGSAYYEDGEYVWETTGSNIHWAPAMFVPEEIGGSYTGDPDLGDVVVRAEFTIVSGEGVAGVFCREAPDTDAEAEWYEFVVRDGFAAIRRADFESNLEVLASTEEVRLPQGDEFALEATCSTGDDGTAELGLLLDDELTLSATDAEPIAPGPVGQQGYTHPMHAPMTVRWNSFTVTTG